MARVASPSVASPDLHVTTDRSSIVLYRRSFGSLASAIYEGTAITQPAQESYAKFANVSDGDCYWAVPLLS